MATPTPTLTFRDRAPAGGLAVSLDRLIESKLLVQANSGGGKYKKSSRDTYLQRLHAAGFVEIAGVIRATDAGLDALGPDFEPLPTGEALQAYWLDRLSGGERAILEVLLQAYPDAVAREEISERTPYKRSSRDTYIQRLSARKLVESTGRAEVRASATLFEER